MAKTKAKTYKLVGRGSITGDGYQLTKDQVITESQYKQLNKRHQSYCELVAEEKLEVTNVNEATGANETTNVNEVTGANETTNVNEATGVNEEGKETESSTKLDDDKAAGSAEPPAEPAAKVKKRKKADSK